MKKTLIIFLLGFAAISAYGQDADLRGQERTVEIRTGWGVESSFSWADDGGLCFMCCYDPVEPTINLDDIRPVSHKYTTGPLWAGVAINISKRWDIGANAIYDRFWQDFAEGRISGSYYSLQAMVRFNYVNTDWVKLYSSLSVGSHIVTHMEELPDMVRTSEMIPDMQLNCLGISVGKTVFGFAEFGVGARGLISGGMGYRF